MYIYKSEMSSIQANVNRPTKFVGRWSNSAALTAVAQSWTVVNNFVLKPDTYPLFNADTGSTLSTSTLRWRADLGGFQTCVDGNYSFSMSGVGISQSSGANQYYEASINIIQMPAYGTYSGYTQAVNTSSSANTASGINIVARSGLAIAGAEAGCSGSAYLPALAVITPMFYTSAAASTTIPANGLVFNMSLVG